VEGGKQIRQRKKKKFPPKRGFSSEEGNAGALKKAKLNRRESGGKEQLEKRKKQRSGLKNASLRKISIRTE